VKKGANRVIRGVRGATTVKSNIETEILNAAEELFIEMIEKNEINPSDVASVFISTTEDLDAGFPAKGMRQIEGWQYVPVMCMREMPVPNSLKMCIRVMLHLNTDKNQTEIHHVYLREAHILRPDLEK
jgi:chorismate mutase